MNVFLWILQIVLALFCLAGGAYKVFSFDELAKMQATAALPHVAWTALGVFEMLCGILLVIPGTMHWTRTLTPVTALALAVESLMLAFLFARYSLGMTAENPLVWAVAMLLIAAFVAYGRYALRPMAV